MQPNGLCVVGNTMSKTECKTAANMTEAMETTMQRLQQRFQSMSEQLESKLDQMGARINDLEKNVTELMTQAGMEEQPTSKGRQANSSSVQ